MLFIIPTVFDERKHSINKKDIRIERKKMMLLKREKRLNEKTKKKK